MNSQRGASENSSTMRHGVNSSPNPGVSNFFASRQSAANTLGKHSYVDGGKPLLGAQNTYMLKKQSEEAK